MSYLSILGTRFLEKLSKKSLKFANSQVTRWQLTHFSSCYKYFFAFVSTGREREM